MIVLYISAWIGTAVQLIDSVCVETLITSIFVRQAHRRG